MRAAMLRPLATMCVGTALLVWSALPTAGQNRTGGQAIPDRPGGARPVRLTAPRVAPLPEVQWTDVHKQLVAKYLPVERPGNGMGTLLTVPELVDGMMPFQKLHHARLEPVSATPRNPHPAHGVAAQQRIRMVGACGDREEGRADVRPAAPRRAGPGCARVGRLRSDAASPCGSAVPEFVGDRCDVEGSRVGL